MSIESPIFEDFIISCLNSKNNKYNYNQISLSKDSFDCVANGGIYGLTENRTYIKIKYSNNSSIAKKLTENFKNNINNKSSLVIIGLWEEESNYDGIIIRGKEYVKKLAFEYPELYWAFAVSNDRDARIQMIDGGNKIELITRVLGLEDFPPIISVDDIEKIKLSNIHEFQRITTFENKKPAIICGNGISIPFGSDPWGKLTDSVFDYLTPFYIDNVDNVKRLIGNSNYLINSMAIHYLKKDEFGKALSDCIYRKYNKSKMHTKYTLLHAIAESKYNDPRMPVITYNYDTFIENDLEKYHPDFFVSSVSASVSDKKNSEPKIKHVHGIIFDKKNPILKNIVLSSDQYFLAYKTGKQWTYKTQYDALYNNICLYVGSSMSDLYQMSVINDVKKEYENNEKRVWKCFALMCLKDVSAKDKISMISYFMSKGIYIIFVSNYDELPNLYKKIFDEIFQKNHRSLLKTNS